MWVNYGYAKRIMNFRRIPVACMDSDLKDKKCVEHNLSVKYLQFLKYSVIYETIERIHFDEFIFGLKVSVWKRWPCISWTDINCLPFDISMNWNAEQRLDLTFGNPKRKINLIMATNWITCTPHIQSTFIVSVLLIWCFHKQRLDTYWDEYLSNGSNLPALLQRNRQENGHERNATIKFKKITCAPHAHISAQFIHKIVTELNAIYF